ncbi:MAG: sulfide/dihydroorotate dehydrogenase-like FAD/NAD-binding protein [Oscillospiraceae bacterium]|nr:sulfide/dihydroorotate dehydrogenase-like FAD/NAD-binding protein [Oscillospiraceae bacterium]
MPNKYEIMRKEDLTPDVVRVTVYAPLVARKAKPGQFIILRTDERGERIPLTISSCHEDGGVSVVVQKVGDSTMTLGEMNEGDCLQDFVGPLGVPTEIPEGGKVAVIGGGLGCAIALPVAKAMHDAGCDVDLIGGFRSKNIVILEDEMKAACHNLYICTDDGSYGFNGMVTAQLKELIDSGVKYDMVFAVGPLIMMKFVCKLTKEYNIPTMVSMNPIMIDGTGMCGCCRVTVGGQVKFACVDGPDFDGHLVDFDETMARAATYKEFEINRRREHQCRLEGMQNA